MISPDVKVTWHKTDKPECWQTWRLSTAITDRPCLCMSATSWCLQVQSEISQVNYEPWWSMSVWLLNRLSIIPAMSFFGLTEYQKISQYIFEETFNLRFAIPFEQHNSTLSMQAFESLTPFQKKKIKDINALDLELYDFAKQLMFQRWVKVLMASHCSFYIKFFFIVQRESRE